MVGMGGGWEKKGGRVGAQPIRNMSHPFETCSQVHLKPILKTGHTHLKLRPKSHLKAIIQSELVFERDIAILNIVWYNSS